MAVRQVSLGRLRNIAQWDDAETLGVPDFPNDGTVKDSAVAGDVLVDIGGTVYRPGSFTGASGTMTTLNNATPDVTDVTLVLIAAASGVNITDFLGGSDRHVITIIGGGSGISILDNPGVGLQLSGNWTDGLGDTLQLIYYNTVWYEISRSPN